MFSSIDSLPDLHLEDIQHSSERAMDDDNQTEQPPLCLSVIGDSLVIGGAEKEFNTNCAQDESCNGLWITVIEIIL